MRVSRAIFTGAVGCVFLSCPCAATEAPSPSAHLSVIRYGYDYSAAARSALAEAQHVICDECPQERRLVGYVEPMVKKVRINSPHVAGTSEPETSGQEEPATRLEEAAPASLPVGAKPEVVAWVVHFSFGSFELGRDAIRELDQTIRKVKEHSPGDVDVRVAGYTCRIGEKGINNILAKRRAETVSAYLGGHGVPVSSKSGEGECCYVSDTHLWKNRRVEIYMKEKGRANAQ